MKYNLLFIFSMIFAGCSMKQSSVNKESKKFAQQEIIAKFADLPDAPFQTCLQSIALNQENHDELQMFYTTTMSVQDLEIFYHQQMERLGWELLSESKSRNSIFIYRKPHLICLIVISHESLSIYFMNKKAL